MRRPSPAVSPFPSAALPPAGRTVLVLLGVLAIAGCAGDRLPASIAGAGADSAASGAPILTVVAVRAGGEGEAAFEGFLEPVIDAVVPARSTGVVREVLVREGARVK